MSTRQRYYSNTLPIVGAALVLVGAMSNALRTGDPPAESEGWVRDIQYAGAAICLIVFLASLVYGWRTANAALSATPIKKPADGDRSSGLIWALSMLSVVSTVATGFWDAGVKGTNKDVSIAAAIGSGLACFSLGLRLFGY